MSLSGLKAEFAHYPGREKKQFQKVVEQKSQPQGTVNNLPVVVPEKISETQESINNLVPKKIQEQQSQPQGTVNNPVDAEVQEQAQPQKVKEQEIPILTPLVRKYREHCEHQEKKKVLTQLRQLQDLSRDNSHFDVENQVQEVFDKIVVEQSKKYNSLTKQQIKIALRHPKAMRGSLREAFTRNPIEKSDSLSIKGSIAQVESHYSDESQKLSIKKNEIISTYSEKLAQHFNVTTKQLQKLIQKYLLRVKYIFAEIRSHSINENETRTNKAVTRLSIEDYCSHQTESDSLEHVEGLLRLILKLAEKGRVNISDEMFSHEMENWIKVINSIQNQSEIPLDLQPLPEFIQLFYKDSALGNRPSINNPKFFIDGQEIFTEETKSFFTEYPKDISAIEKLEKEKKKATEILKLTEKFVDQAFANRVTTNKDEAKIKAASKELAKIIQLMHTQASRNFIFNIFHMHFSSDLEIHKNALIKADFTNPVTLNVEMDSSHEEPIIVFKFEPKNIDVLYTAFLNGDPKYFPAGKLNCTCEFKFQLKKDSSNDSSSFNYWEPIDHKIEIENGETGLEYLNPDKIGAIV